MGAPGSTRRRVYGPAFTLASEPLAVVAGDSDAVAAWTYKALAAAAALGAALLAGRLARRRAFAIALVGWNPLLAVHLAGGGHNDAWVGALILAALALSASRRRAERRRALGARDRRQVGADLSSSLSARSRHARRGRAHGARGFAVAAAAIALGASVLYGGAWPLAIVPLAGNAALETSYAIPHRLEQLGLPDDVALGLAVAALVGGLVWLAREAGRGRARLAPRRLPRARDDAVSGRLVPGVGGAARRRRGGRRRDGRRASLSAPTSCRRRSRSETDAIRGGGEGRRRRPRPGRRASAGRAGERA